MEDTARNMFLTPLTITPKYIVKKLSTTQVIMDMDEAMG
jgi:hypothetical protein